jgi:hypothetical protein
VEYMDNKCDECPAERREVEGGNDEGVPCGSRKDCGVEKFDRPDRGVPPTPDSGVSSSDMSPQGGSTLQAQFDQTCHPNPNLRGKGENELRAIQLEQVHFSFNTEDISNRKEAP